MDDSEKNSGFINSYLQYLLLAQKSKTTTENPSLIDPLSDYERNVIDDTLTELINQIAIISKGNKSHSLSMASMRFSKKRNRENSISETLDQLQPLKFENDIEDICSILYHTISEVNRSGTIDHLKRQLKKNTDEATKEYEFILDYIKNVVSLKEFCDRSKECYVKYQTKIKNLNDQIQTMESQIQDWQIQNKMKHDLVVKWEKTRHEQALIIFKNEEIKLLNMINSYEINSTQEEIVIKEIEKFIDFKIKGFEQSIIFWIVKYNTDVADYNARIKKTKEHIADVQGKINEIKEKHRIQQVFIDGYRDEQRIIMEKKKYEQRQYDSATTIQSWWRGTMVRRQLGPYKPKKKAGKKGKKK